MRKLLFSFAAFIALSGLIITSQTSCKKETVTNTVTNTDTVYQCNSRIEGLWVGTYSPDGQGVPAGTQFYFSFSIYPDGKMSYKSDGLYNGSNYVTFADGTWSLSGNNFSFSVTTVNIAGGGAEHTQSGTAIYNSTNGTLINGTVADAGIGTGTWNMTRIN